MRQKKPEGERDTDETEEDCMERDTDDTEKTEGERDIGEAEKD